MTDLVHSATGSVDPDHPEAHHQNHHQDVEGRPREGYVGLSRKMFDGRDRFWPAPGTRAYQESEAWIDIIQMAAYRDGAVVDGVQLKRGEVYMPLRFLAHRWNWGIKTVRIFLKRLEQIERIRAQKRARTGAHIQVTYVLTNYGRYNPTHSEKGTEKDTEEGTDKGTERARRGHIDEEGKKVRNDYTSDFERFWSVYPHRQDDSKSKAFRVWKTRLTEGVAPNRMIEGAERYAAMRAGQDPQYTKMAATFLGPDRHFLAEMTTTATTPSDVMAGVSVGEVSRV